MEFQKILIVDDSRTARMLIEKCIRMIRPEEIEYLEADDGDIALEIITNRNPDLIITDVIMPRMNGTELVERIRALPGHRQTPIVMLTSLDRDAVCLKAEVKASILISQKPVTPESMATVLESLP